MPEYLFRGLFDPAAVTTISPGDFLLCIGAALVVGLIISLSYLYRSRCSGSFLITLALLPAAVCVVIMMVNGNVGTGVAVAGAFSLVRFRSLPGTAKEITVLFLAMTAGLIIGMGYLAFGLLFALILCAALVVLQRLDLGGRRNDAYRTVSITIPEDLDYADVFDDIFREFTVTSRLVRVKTTNMGSMFRLTYDLTLRDIAREKEMIDHLRCRNGNLEITVSPQESSANAL